MEPFKRNVIRNEINQLNGPVLTFYLNTDPASEEWKIRLKNGLKRTEEYHKISDPQATRQIRDIVKRIHPKVRDMNRNLATSLVCFASKVYILLYTFLFPVTNDFTFLEVPSS